MTTDKDDAIRNRAYQLWEADGRPHGKHHEHWQRAAEELGHAQTGTASGDTHPGMLGDGTEEQNLNQAGNPKARITESEVREAFGSKQAASKP